MTTWFVSFTFSRLNNPSISTDTDLSPTHLRNGWSSSHADEVVGLKCEGLKGDGSWLYPESGELVVRMVGVIGATVDDKVSQ